MGFETIAHQAQLDMEDLIKQYGDTIFRMCFIYLHDTGLAEDAMQETFVKAFRNYTAFKHECSEQSWLMRIAINTCKDMKRSTWFKYVDRRKTLEHLPDAVYEYDPVDDTLIKEVMKLPVKYKDVMLLRYYQNLTIADIATVLHIPVGTVATRLTDAKKRLRRKLERWYFDE